MDNFKFQNGDEAKDVISGLSGIVTSRADHLYGCARYWLAPRTHKDGKPEGGTWFDEDQLEMVKATVIERREYRVVAAEAKPSRWASAVARVAGGPTDQPASSTRAAER